jgi:hypothetical protein
MKPLKQGHNPKLKIVNDDQTTTVVLFVHAMILAPITKMMVSAPTMKTVLLARITVLLDKTIDLLARITVLLDKTIDLLARITVLLDKTIDLLAQTTVLRVPRVRMQPI